VVMVLKEVQQLVVGKIAVVTMMAMTRVEGM
jgi:hypothetical protein